jgi:CheY-like chemotaxis protein/HPt (histidine-containing phosphotransfer) domain-containing protein
MEEKEISRSIDFHSLGYRKVLLAEDVEFNQYIARQMLESWGFEVTVANNGIEVLKCMEEENFDCILMDIQMPEMGGIETAQIIRNLKIPAKANIPIIAVTANALKGDCEKYLAAGMTDFLPKPIEEAQLFQIISRNLLKNDRKLPEPDQKNCKTHTLTLKGRETKLYDLSMVRSVSGGDDDFIKKMVILFIETVPQNVGELNKALKNEDWDQVSKMAHKLKSTVDSMGITSLKTDIRTVEANAKQKESLQQLPSLASKIEAVINDCIKQLHEEILQS